MKKKTYRCEECRGPEQRCHFIVEMESYEEEGPKPENCPYEDGVIVPKWVRVL
tara:strand:- start:484 stop:642 length:159 start_codon:yes stop_codon:yes gene_type:complete